MEYMLIFTFLTMAGLPDEQMLIMENIENREQCLAMEPEAISTWGSLAGIEMGKVEFFDCLPVGRET